MAEPDKCPYCNTGVTLWIWVEKDNVYVLECSYCEASGKYVKPATPETEAVTFNGNGATK